VPQAAFDDHRPPPADLIEACVHCGFCLPTCPSYLAFEQEMDSPRGRIVLMRTGLEQGSVLSDEVVEHLDRCLGCMACVTACPSGVQYDRLIERARPQLERNFDRSRGDRLLRRALFALFTHPGRMRALVPSLAVARRLGLARAAARSRLLRKLPRLRTLATLAPPVRTGAVLARLPALTAARGRRRGRVGLLQGCVQRVFFGDVNRATVRVLAAEGFDVVAPRRPRCCGALQMHAGFEPEARQLARETIEAFEGCDAVAVNVAGCGSAMKEYRHLLDDDPAWAARAAEFSAKVRDVSELLAELQPNAPRHPVPLTIAYHDACHLAHAQAVRAQPRALLSGIPALAVVEPDEWEICCGSAGLYNLLVPQAAAELGRRKAENLLATGASAIVAGNAGCALHIRSQLEGLRRPLPIYHTIELLDASLRGVQLPGAQEGRR
jgi:glycolate oxidase iron-sulfur subunit